MSPQASASLTRLLARSGRLAELLPRLHEAALSAVGGRSSVLLRPDPRTGQLHATSAVGLDYLPVDAWLTSPEGAAAAGRALTTDRPVVVDAVPELDERLGTGRALLVPLTGCDRQEGLLLVGLPEAGPDPDQLAGADEVAGAFVLALGRAGLEREADLLGGLRDLALDLSRSVAASMTLAPGLETFCRGLARLFAADRAVVWLHDRVARELYPAAGSGTSPARDLDRVSVEDALATPALALRRQRAEVIRPPGPADLSGTVTVAVPLRGRRRALGALVLEGVRLDPGGEADVVARADEMALNLSAAIENAQLLEDVLRTRSEREALERRLTQAEKLAALGQFIAGIAHELNNPLQGIIGHLELLKGTALPPAARRDLQTIEREADRTARIVTNLRLFAGSGRLVTRRLSVNRAVTRVLSMRGAALRGAGIEVERRLGPDLPRIHADALMLQQVLLNLVVNAEQALGGPGLVAVHTRRASSGQAVDIEVTDSGPGLSAEALAHAFEPFFTTKEVGRGTGLGLSIAYGIVQAHGGTLTAGNAPEAGARFTISLPAAGRLSTRGTRRRTRS